MADTQWTTADPAGQNPTTVAVSIIDQLNPQFIQAGVKFVIQVGDLADTGNDADETVRAQAAQPLYDAGIGFFPMRGNHETYGTRQQLRHPGSPDALPADARPAATPSAPPTSAARLRSAPSWMA